MDHNVDALIAAIIETGKSLDESTAIYNGIVKTVRRMRATLRLAVIGLIVSLVLLTAFGFLLYNQSQLNDDIKANQEAIHDGQCQLNTLFVKADTPTARDRSPDRARYDSAYHDIYQQRVQLGCQPPIAEPVR